MRTASTYLQQLLAACLLAAAVTVPARAQFRPQPTQYLFNYSTLNPAVTGIENFGQLQGGFRRQWAGIEGAPTSTWLSGSMPLQKYDGPVQINAENDEIFYHSGSGAGFNLYHDKAGPYSTINLNLGYAYHVPLSNTLALSAGFTGGIQQTRYDMSKSIYPDQPYDPAVLSQAAVIKKLSPDFNLGLMLYARKFFVGLSMLQLIPSKFTDLEDNQSKYRSMLVTAAGYNFDLDGDGTHLWLSGLLKSDFANPMRYDITARVRYKALGWVAATYRKGDAIAVGFGVNITPAFTVGYNYDWGINASIATYSKGSHELGLGYRFVREDEGSTLRIAW